MSSRFFEDYCLGTAFTWNV